MKVYTIKAVISTGKTKHKFSLLSPGLDAEEAKTNASWLGLLVEAISGGKSKVRTQRANAVIFGADLKGTSLAATAPKKKRRRK